MVSSNPTGLVETASQGQGQSRLSVSGCFLDSDLSRIEDFILISCIHQGKSCVCNGGEEPTALTLSPQHVTSHSGNPGCSVGWGVVIRGPGKWTPPHPERHHVLWPRSERGGNHWGQHHLHLSFLAKISNVPSSNCKGTGGLLFSQYKQRIRCMKRG